MTRSRKRKLQKSVAKWGGIPLTSAVLAWTNVAYAQQASGAPEGVGLEEVIVTAQKRSEDLQKVPISLQVLGSEQLEQLQVTSLDDYTKFLPSVSYQAFAPGQAQLFFRGISDATGTISLHAGAQPATGVYLDETPVTTIGGAVDVHVYDIARVEALAGPQGTLYGASSLSGTLRIITNKPDPTHFSGSVDVTGNKFKDGNGGGTFEGYVNVPLSDQLAVRLVGYYDHSGGYIDNLPHSLTYQRLDANGKNPDPITVNNSSRVKNNGNYVDTYGGRLAFKYDFNDTWSVTPSVLAQNQQAGGAFFYDPRVGDLKTENFRPDYANDKWYQTALVVQGKIGNIDALYSGGYFERKTDNESDYTAYTIAYDGYSAGYTRFVDANGNLDPTSDPTQYIHALDSYTKLNQEIRFTSPSDQRFRWVLGGFYERQTDNIREEFLVDGLPPNLPGRQVTNWGVTGQGNSLYLTQQDRTDKDSAVFADVTFDLTEKFKMSAGIRQFWVDNTLFGYFGYSMAPYYYMGHGFQLNGERICTRASTDPSRPCIDTDAAVKQNGETHRVNLTYQIGPDHMVYATYSTGYRPGGINRKPTDPPYTADKLDNYELGWKTSWLENQLRFNGALFYELWHDMQLDSQGAGGITSIFNVADAKSQGVEAELSWLPVHNLTLALSGAYADAKTTNEYCSVVGVHECSGSDVVAATGTRLPATPKEKANASARYKFNWGQFDSFVQAAGVYQSSTTFSIKNAASMLAGDTPGFASFDLSAGIAQDKWRLEAYIENVTDKRGELTRVSQCGGAYCSENYRVYPIKPMNYGIKYGVNF